MFPAQDIFSKMRALTVRFFHPIRLVHRDRANPARGRHPVRMSGGGAHGGAHELPPAPVRPRWSHGHPVPAGGWPNATGAVGAHLVRERSPCHFNVIPPSDQALEEVLAAPTAAAPAPFPVRIVLGEVGEHGPLHPFVLAGHASLQQRVSEKKE